MIRYRTRVRSTVGLPRVSLSITVIICILALILFVDRALMPVMIAIAEEKAMIMVTDRIGATVEELLHINIDSTELVRVDLDDQGRVAMLRPDSLRVSRLAAQVTLAVQDELKRMEGDVFYIPLGQTLGSSILAGLGPGIPVTMFPIGSASVFVGDKFEDAGINQTRHVLYLDVTASIRVVVPLQRRRVEVTAHFPVCDTVVVGEVPRAYLNFRSPD